MRLGSVYDFLSKALGENTACTARAFSIASNSQRFLSLDVRLRVPPDGSVASKPMFYWRNWQRKKKIEFALTAEKRATTPPLLRCGRDGRLKPDGESWTD